MATEANTPSQIIADPSKEPIQRNYVFVDEQNRHKRLKVMRACEGCRRRKIKCDSATTNTWPCAACVRFKTECIPPTINFEDKPNAPGIHVFELQKSPTFPPGQTGFNQVNQVNQANQVNEVNQLNQFNHARGEPPLTTYFTEYQPQHHRSPELKSETSDTNVSLQEFEPRPKSTEWGTQSSVQPLADAFGGLQIGVDGIGGYIRDNQTKEANFPVLQEEEEAFLPAMVLSPGARIKIPDVMMPNEAQAQQFFDYFFKYIHPFVPVLCQNDFYHKWQTDKDSIPPIILEAIFACSTALMDRLPENRQWLALASKHEEYYKDSPRLSTVQAWILVLKAREAHPKKGYFYRSWMTLVNIIAMCKDLELDRHYLDHEEGAVCQFSAAECVSRTRIWQCLFIMETMVGPPQGRLNLNIPKESVDLKDPPIIPGIDSQDHLISRQYVKLVKVVHNTRCTIDIYRESIRKKDSSFPSWPAFERLNSQYADWIISLPEDLQVTIPENDYDQWQSTAFLGHMHSYYYLSLVMHHRARFNYQIELDSNGSDWKSPLMICLNAAKNVLCIQESLLRTMGPPGLECMLRGLSFTVYASLTCTMFNLAAITAPDHEISRQGRLYFERYMRLLESSTRLWPMDNVKAELRSLQEAFSADVNQPFRLREDFPIAHSPISHSSSITPALSQDLHFISASMQQNNVNQPLTPPISVIGEDYQTDSHVPQSIPLLSAHQVNPQGGFIPDQWNPNPIFSKFDSTFLQAPRSMSDPYSPSSSHLSAPADFDLSPQTYQQTSHAPPYFTPSSTSSNDHPPSQQQQHQHQQHHNMGMPTMPQLQHHPNSYPQTHNHNHNQNQHPISFPAYRPEFVSPSTWQHVIANTYGNRLKRGWEPADTMLPMKKYMGS